MRQMIQSASNPAWRLYTVLAGSSLVSVGLYLAGAWGNHERDFAYMVWNLFLAWVALGVTFWLQHILKRNLWSSWYALAVTLVWMLFLPNTFYIVTDLIHLQEVPKHELLYGTVMLTSFVVNGLVLGFVSLNLIHRELLKRLTRRVAHGLIAFVLLVCSFAIYIGRELRWNSWDVLTNPLSLLFDVTDRLLYASHHPHMIATTLSFFVFLLSFYALLWQLAGSRRKI